MSDAIKTLLAPGCKLDSQTEVVDAGFDLPTHHVGQVLQQLIERLGMVLVRVAPMEGNSYHYELVPLQKAGERYFAHRKDMGR